MTERAAPTARAEGPSYTRRVAGRSTKKTMTRIAYTTLRDEILSLRLTANQPLIETEISQMLDMSKTPVREALLMLSRDGLVELNDFRGARVSDLSSADAREIYQLRVVLEPLALRLSHANSTAADYATLRTVLADARGAAERGDRAQLAALNREFHFGLVARCGNERLLTILRRFSDQVRLISMRVWVSHPSFGDEALEHAAILGAVADGDDADRAAELLRSHIADFAQRIVGPTTCR